MFTKEFIRGIAVGSTLAAGVGVAAMIGAGTASAAPGISYDGGPGDPIGFGDTSPSGAQASASNNNKALAISIFKPAKATADGQNRTGNTVVAIDGTAGFLKSYTDPYTGDHDNNVVAINGTALVNGEWTNMVAIGGKTANRLNVIDVNGGHVFERSQALATFPIVVPNTVVSVCGQQLSGDRYIFETSGNCAS